MRLDHGQFDNLTGMPLYLHARGVAEKDVVDAEDVTMFRRRASEMDLQHSEMMLLLLAKSSCKEAHSYLAGFLLHSNLPLRFAASKLVAQLASADESVMQAIVQALTKADQSNLREEFEGILRRPANESARLIAEAFLAKEQEF